VKIIDFSAERAEPIARFASVGASSVRLGDGHGEAHVYCVRFEPGGKIGEHPTGFGQLFLVVEGAGWVSGQDGVRVELMVGQGAYFARGELHAKGSDVGMTAIMIQIQDLEPTATVD
jgi:quercetin dioxygenase-like cupin family protein